MEETTTVTTTRSAGMTFGLYTGIASILLFVILSMAGINPFGNWSYIGLVISIVLLVLAQKKFKDDGDGFMTYGQGIAITFWFTLISMALGLIVRYLYITFFDDAPMTMMLEEQSAKMLESGSSQDQIDVANEWTVKLFWPIGAVFGFIFGIILGLIVTIFTQKKNPQGDFN